MLAAEIIMVVRVVALCKTIPTDFSVFLLMIDCSDDHNKVNLFAVFETAGPHIIVAEDCMAVGCSLSMFVALSFQWTHIDIQHE